VAIAVRLDLVSFCRDLPDQARIGLRNPALDEERALGVGRVEQLEHALDVPSDALADRCFEIDT
jgi:hypothetical protein